MGRSAVDEGVSVPPPSVAERAALASSAAVSAACARAASGSSFYAAMRMLPAAQRDAMFAIYDFCRAVDDVADGPGDHATRLAALAQWRAEVDALFQGMASPRVAALDDAVQAFALRKEDFIAILDGVEMDALADIVAPELPILDLYCDRVASAVGRLSVRVFGLARSDGDDLAFHLGRALQLTNILRDLDEDAGKGRLYLPREALEASGIEVTDIRAVLAHPRLDAACRAVADRAQWHFEHANRIMARYPLRTVRAPILMARAYQMILGRLLDRGFAPPRKPVRTSRGALLWSALRYGLVRPR